MGNIKDSTDYLAHSECSVILSSLICSSEKLEIPQCSIIGDWRDYETSHVV